MFILLMHRKPQKQTKQELRQKIEPGDLILVADGINQSFFNPFLIANMMFNEEEIHTLYAVEYQSQVYLINSHMTDYFNSRMKTFADPSSVIVIESNSRGTGCLEPLDEFLYAEEKKKSYVRIVKTKKKAPLFDMSRKELFKEISSKTFVQCSMVIAKYLESHGVISNTSGFTDFLYYTPDVLRSKLGVVSNTLYQLND